MVAVTTILGCLEFGRFNSTELKTCEQLLETFLSFGYKELDTAYMYNGGQTEEIMGMIKVCQDKTKVSIATKANPWSEKGLQYDRVIEQLDTSLQRMKVDCVDLFYLHCPDSNTPIEETLKAVDALHKAGKFKEFGLSNYLSWEVAEIYYLCKMNGWVLPTVYQGMYNVITRSAEKELFPCLRRLGIRFYAYNPLAGGFLTGKHKLVDQPQVQAMGRFAGTGVHSQMYRARYWIKDNFEQLDKIKKTLDDTYGEGQVSLAVASLRWMYHHSKLSGQVGDGVILGAGSINHLVENLKASKSEPLHPDVVAAFEEAWEVVKPHCPDYNGADMKKFLK